MKEFVPSNFILSQNFPNPFERETKIKYCLSAKTKVNLDVFNSDGEKAKELVNIVQDAGTYEVKLDVGDFPDGSYYYRIQALDTSTGAIKPFIDIKKMILLRKEKIISGKTMFCSN